MTTPANQYTPANPQFTDRAIWDRINFLLKEVDLLKQKVQNASSGGTQIARLTTQVQAASDALTQLQTFVGKGQTQFVGGGGAITGLTGDGVATGPGTVPLTLATVNASPGSYTNANITVNAKGLVTLASNGAGGSASTLEVVKTAGTILGGNRAVKIDTATGRAIYANNTDINQAELVLGITTGAAAALAPVTVLMVGQMTEPSWTWTPGLPIYLGVTGLLTQTAPTSDSITELGIAQEATVMLVRIQETIFL